MARSKVLSIEPEEVEDGTQSARITWLEEINMELLEACEALIGQFAGPNWYCPLCSEHYFVYEGHTETCRLRPVEEAVRAAVAKAKGEDR